MNFALHYGVSTAIFAPYPDSADLCSPYTEGGSWPQGNSYEYSDYLTEACLALTYLQRVAMDHAPFVQCTDLCKFNQLCLVRATRVGASLFGGTSESL